MKFDLKNIKFWSFFTVFGQFLGHFDQKREILGFLEMGAYILSLRLILMRIAFSMASLATKIK